MLSVKIKIGYTNKMTFSTVPYVSVPLPKLAVVVVVLFEKKEGRGVGSK